MPPKVSIQFQGTETLDEIFTKLPSELRRPAMLKIFAKASSKFLSQAKQPFVGSTKKGIGFVYGKSQQRPALYAGLVRKGGNSWQYQRAYWRNFGTYARRDPNHTFVNPRKRISANYKGGMEPSNAVGKAWEANQQNAAQVIETEAAAIVNKFLQQKAKRR